MKRAIAAGAAFLVLTAGTFWTRSPVARDAFVIKDVAGKVRMKLESDPESNAAMLKLFGPDGAPQASLASGLDGPALTFFDKDGSARLQMGLASGSPTLDVVAKNGPDVQSVNLLGGREATISSAPRSDGRGWRPTGPRVREASRSPVIRHVSTIVDRYCRPGMLGCARVSRAERSSLAGG